MQEIPVEIKNFNILNIECHADNTGCKDGTTLRATNTGEWQRTTEPKDKFGRVTLETVIESEDGKIKLAVKSQTVFDIEKWASTDDDNLVETCSAVALQRVYEAIRDISKAMGMTPIDFTNKA